MLRSVILIGVAVTVGACVAASPGAIGAATDAEREPGDAIVIVLDPAGSPIAGVSVWFKPADDDGYVGGDNVVTDSRGVARSRETVLRGRGASDSGYDIVLVHRGYRSVVLRGFEGVATVRLVTSAPTRVRVRISEDSVLPEPPHRLELRLDWMNTDGDGDPRRLAPLPVHGRSSPDVLEFVVDDPGQYVLNASAHVRAGDLWPDDPRPNTPLYRGVDTKPKLPLVTIEPGVEVEEIELRVDASRRGAEMR